MTEQRRNSYEDSDFRDVLAELDEMDDEAEEIMASARGKVSAIRKRQQNRIKIADKELQIPPSLLRTVRKQRKLERQMQALADDVPDDLIEVFEDAAGQFSLFKPHDDEEPAETAAQAAARKRKAAVQAAQDAEQEEGAKALEELTSVH